MDTGTLHAKALCPVIGCAVLASLLACPAPAGDNVQVVPLYLDARGNEARVEIESMGERKKATPLLVVGDKRLERMLDNPEEKGTLAIPVPRLMRLVERARQAIREMKRPVARPPAGPGTAAATEPAVPARDPCETTPRQTTSFTPPERTGTVIRPPAALVSAATR